MRHLFKSSARGDLLYGVPSQDQASRLTVDTAQSRRRCYHAVESTLTFCRHVCCPFVNIVCHRYAVNLDCEINLRQEGGQNVRDSERYMTAREAAEALGVSRGTLYSYVSRGMLDSDPVVGKPRL